MGRTPRSGVRAKGTRIYPAEGINDCSYVNGRKTLGATLWITDQEEFIHQSRRMGVVGFLVKPVSDEVLRETVERLLES